MFRKFWKWIQGLFNSTKAIIEQYGTPSIQLVENLKSFVDSPACDILTAIIPGSVDDAIKTSMRKYLPIVIQDLKIAYNAPLDSTPQQLLEYVLVNLKDMLPEEKQEALTRIATKLTSYLAGDHSLSWGKLVSLIVFKYENDIKKA